MYPRTYYETFARYQASDEIFVAMPFTADFERSYEAIIRPAIERVRRNGQALRPNVINRGTVGSPDIHERIYDAIIHSRLVIADMSVQSQYSSGDKVHWQANANVAYEVGLATAWRNPEDILLIHRLHDAHSYSFDIQNLRHVSYDLNNAEESSIVLSEEIKNVLSRSAFISQNSLDTLAKGVSPSAVQLMHSEVGRVFPAIQFSDVHNSGIFDSRQRAIDELLRVGALRARNVIGQAHHSKATLAIVYEWTELGYRLLLIWKAADASRIARMKELAASVPRDKLPPQPMLDLPKDRENVQ